MVAGCGNKCVKYIFWAINFLLFALGVVILAFSVWMRVDSSMMVKLVNQGNISLSNLPMDTIYYILYGIMVIGGVLLILGFLGCCGSACESLCAIGLYFLLVIIIFVVKIVAIVMYFVKKDSIREYVTYVLREFGVRNYSTQQVYRNIMDQLQQGLYCCGAYSCNDWATYGQAIPTTCANCAYNPPGCGYKFWTVLEGNLLIVLVICFAILVIELLAMILSCVMCGAVKDKRNQSY